MLPSRESKSWGNEEGDGEKGTRASRRTRLYPDLVHTSVQNGVDVWYVIMRNT